MFSETVVPSCKSAVGWFLCVPQTPQRPNEELVGGGTDKNREAESGAEGLARAVTRPLMRPPGSLLLALVGRQRIGTLT